MPMFLSYRNQSIDLQYKSIDWFLYEGNIGMKKVKMFAEFKIKKKEKNLDRLRDITPGLHRNRSQYVSPNLFSTIFLVRIDEAGT